MTRLQPLRKFFKKRFTRRWLWFVAFRSPCCRISCASGFNFEPELHACITKFCILAQPLLLFPYRKSLFHTLRRIV